MARLYGPGITQPSVGEIRMTLLHLEKEGWIYQNLRSYERRKGRCRHVLYRAVLDFIHVLALREENGKARTLAICPETNRADVAQHCREYAKNSYCRLWLQSGNELEIWFWAKRPNPERSGQMNWLVKRIPITEELIRKHQEEPPCPDPG